MEIDPGISLFLRDDVGMCCDLMITVYLFEASVINMIVCASYSQLNQYIHFHLQFLLQVNI